MRPLLKHRTPAQLLWMIGATNVLVSLSFGVLGVGSRHYPHAQHRPLQVALFSFGALVLGLIGTLIAGSNLRTALTRSDGPMHCSTLPGRSLPTQLFDPPVLAHHCQFCGHHLFAQREFERSLDVSLSGDEPTRVISALRPRRTNADGRSRMDPSKPLQSEHWGSPPRPYST